MMKFNFWADNSAVRPGDNTTIEVLFNTLGMEKHVPIENGILYYEKMVRMGTVYTKTSRRNFLELYANKFINEHIGGRKRYIDKHLKSETPVYGLAFAADNTQCLTDFGYVGFIIKNSYLEVRKVFEKLADINLSLYRLDDSKFYFETTDVYNIKHIMDMLELIRPISWFVNRETRTAMRILDATGVAKRNRFIYAWDDDKNYLMEMLLKQLWAANVTYNDFKFETTKREATVEELQSARFEKFQKVAFKERKPTEKKVCDVRKGITITPIDDDETIIGHPPQKTKGKSTYNHSSTKAELYRAAKEIRKFLDSTRRLCP